MNLIKVQPRTQPTLGKSLKVEEGLYLLWVPGLASANAHQMAPENVRVLCGMKLVLSPALEDQDNLLYGKIMKALTENREFCVMTWKYEVCMYPQMRTVDGVTTSYPFYIWQRAHTWTRKTFKCTWRAGTRGNPGDWEPVKASERREFDKGPTSDPTHIHQKPEGKGRALSMSSPTFCNAPGKCKGKIWQEAANKRRYEQGSTDTHTF